MTLHAADTLAASLCFFQQTCPVIQASSPRGLASLQHSEHLRVHVDHSATAAHNVRYRRANNVNYLIPALCGRALPVLQLRVQLPHHLIRVGKRREDVEKPVYPGSAIEPVDG